MYIYIYMPSNCHNDIKEIGKIVTVIIFISQMTINVTKAISNKVKTYTSFVISIFCAAFPRRKFLKIIPVDKHI
jgi:hypothetical protein